MTLRYIALALLINIVVSAPACDDAVPFDQCEHLDCTAFPDLAVQFCPNTCQVCHKVNDTSSNPGNAGCQDSMSFAQCHLLDCVKFPDLAQQYCQRTCGVCPTCTDNADCLTFGPSICTAYPELAIKACPAYCNLCDGLAGNRKRFLEDPKPTVDIVTNNRECVDKGGPDLCKFVDCEKFPYEASHFCQRSCGYCRLCDDVSPNCAKFGQQICTSLREWSAFNCAKYCNFCQECNDHSDCSQYINNLCEKFPELGQIECSRTCHFCEAYFVPSEFLNMSYATSIANKTTPTPTTTTTTTTTTIRPVTTRSTTPTTTTTTQPTTTTQKLLTHSCNKFGLIHDVAERLIVTNPSAGKCLAASGTHSRSEAVIMEHCLAPNVTEWRQGEKVVDNCDRIPRYTPVATFSFGRYVMSSNYMSAVFIECEPGGFKMIAQFCGYPPMIEHVKLNSPNNIENANHYYLINW